MEEKFLTALSQARQEALAMGVRIRPVADMAAVHRCLTGHRESDGFYQLAEKKALRLSLEALAVRKEFSALFSDDEANCALGRLMDGNYFQL